LHRRGAIVSTAQPASARVGITLAGIPVASEDETKHFKLIGTTGTGKSTAIQEILAAALARGDRAIIADPDGGYLRRFYDPARDVILNPFDGDARKWDLFGEITNDYDVEQLARSLIPDSGGSDRIWSEYARTFFSALTQQAIRSDTRDIAELYRLLTGAVPVAELRQLLAGTPAWPFLEEGNEKMLGSVRSVLSSAVGALQYTIRQQATPLSVRQWVRQGAARHTGGRGGVLFVPYKAGEIAALGSVISAWMRLGIFEAMDLDEGDQRLWFVVDELDALGAIDGLKDALARLRKFGGRCILGFQSIAQVSGTYGRGAAETIVENCGNTLILRCSASERGGTSEFASKLIGQREVVHTTSSKTRKPTDWLSSTTRSEQLKIEPAVMASEIERLPDLTGYLKLASIPDWMAVKLTPISEPAPARPRRPARVVSPSAPVPQAPVHSPAAVGPEPHTPMHSSAATGPEPQTPVHLPAGADPEPQTGAPSPAAATRSDGAATRRRKPRVASPRRSRPKKPAATPSDAPPHDIEGQRVALPEIVTPQEISAPADGLGAVQSLTGQAKLPD
jgi:type IV secretory pathway TraG/TraD family ATPase VirD4